jgi:hypothetical protein
MKAQEFIKNKQQEEYKKLYQRASTHVVDVVDRAGFLMALRH